MSLKNLSVKNKIPKLFKNKLNNQRINRVYNKFEKSLMVKGDFAVAVSGGPDSLALAFLAKIFSLKTKIPSRFFIVDHKLRPGSTNEAKAVKKVLKKISINSEILTWKGKKPSKNIQSIARVKRYELLFKQCDKYNIKDILLGHHQDDLLENFFIRMTRGSGLKGLVSLDINNTINNKNVLRPLLNQKKEDLVFVSKKIFNFYVEDPTNQDEKYQRIKVRKLIEELKKNGLDKKKFLKSINNLKISNKSVNFYVNENLKKNTYFSKMNNNLILNRSFFLQPYEIVFRSFSESIKIIGGKYYPVRGKKLDKVLDNINNNHLFKTTLGGCIIEKVSQTVIISKEF